MDSFGIFMKDMRCKVTNDPRQLQRMTIIPCQIGFKDNDTWYNIWCDIKVTSRTHCEGAYAKGDTIKVSGRMDYREYNGKPQWSVWADSVESYGNANMRQPFDGGGDDCPF